MIHVVAWFCMKKLCSLQVVLSDTLLWLCVIHWKRDIETGWMNKHKYPLSWSILKFVTSCSLGCNMLMWTRLVVEKQLIMNVTLLTHDCILPLFASPALSYTHMHTWHVCVLLFHVSMLWIWSSIAKLQLSIQQHFAHGETSFLWQQLHFPDTLAKQDDVFATWHF